MIYIIHAYMHMYMHTCMLELIVRDKWSDFFSMSPDKNLTIKFLLVQQFTPHLVFVFVYI